MQFPCAPGFLPWRLLSAYQRMSRPFWCHTKNNSFNSPHSGTQSCIWDSPNWQCGGVKLCSHMSCVWQKRCIVSAGHHGPDTTSRLYTRLAVVHFFKYTTTMMILMTVNIAKFYLNIFTAPSWFIPQINCNVFFSVCTFSWFLCFLFVHVSRTNYFSLL
jgi:hypothetical protein